MSFLTDTFGRRIEVPELERLDLGELQQRAIESNQAALPAAQQLTSEANLFTQQQIDQMLERAMPNYQAIRSNVGRNIESMTKGEVPADVQRAIQDSAAAKALSRGFAGSQKHGNIIARDLGLTSLDLTNRGIASADAWLRNTAALYQPSMINLSSMFISPEQQAAFDVNERNMQWQRQYLQEQIDAMPDPLIRGIQDSIAEVGMAFLGGSHTPYYQNADQASRTSGMQFGSPYKANPYSDNPGYEVPTDPWADYAAPGNNFGGFGAMAGGGASGASGVGSGVSFGAGMAW